VPQIVQNAPAAGAARDLLDRVTGPTAPGLQYVVLDKDGTLFERACGWAEVGARVPMTLDATLMAYSMTKTITAVAVLQLVEAGKLRLDAAAVSLLDAFPYGDQVTIRQLLTHTAGIPNPIPLRWAHLAEEDSGFDEAAALARVLAAHPRPVACPGERYLYSNIGYWLLGNVVATAAGRPYVVYVRERILGPLGIAAESMDFGIPRSQDHAAGYVGRFTALNVLKRLVVDRRLWVGTEGRWLRFASHHLDGPAFGGLVGTARAFGAFLRDHLQPRSVLLGPEMSRVLRTPATDNRGLAVPMTGGWHVRSWGGLTVLYKEGGGGGFHGEMRIYPERGIGSVIMANGTEFGATAALDRVDAVFLEAM
jgi:D-alanyl-D-alanine carboxypeptidase